MTRVEQDEAEDPFKDSDEWIAAEGRQFFRALSAYDPKAVEVVLFHLHYLLSKTLGRHLRQLPRWAIKGLWFDGLDAPETHVELPSKMHVSAWLVCVVREDEKEDWWREPFDFELRLCPQSGQFQGYRFRVGDHRPREDKRVVGLEVGMSKRIELEPFRIVDLPPVAPIPVGGWLEEIVRGRFLEDSPPG